MVCSLHSVTTGSRDRANVPLIIIIIVWHRKSEHQCLFMVQSCFGIFKLAMSCLENNTLLHKDLMQPAFQARWLHLKYQGVLYNRSFT